MTTQEYLSQISRLDRMIKNKLTELAQLKELAYGLSSMPKGERVQTTPNYDKIGTAVCKIESMEESINTLVAEYADKKSKIIAQIDSMEDETHYDVLFLRYIEKKTFEKIAADMDYSFRNITRLHARALQEFEKRYGKFYLDNKDVS